jgi:hypothetical protein
MFRANHQGRVCGHRNSWLYCLKGGALRVTGLHLIHRCLEVCSGSFIPVVSQSKIRGFQNFSILKQKEAESTDRGLV